MKTIRLALFLGLLLAPALAQAQDLELTAYGGYNLGGSIDVQETSTKSKLNTQDSFATGLSLTWQRGPSNAFELFWGWRPTHVEGKNLSGQNTQFTTLNEHDFHANFLFMPAYRDTKFTPFFLFGLGATYLNPGDVTIPGGATVSPSGYTKFSFALGAGVKGFMSDKFGLRAQVRYHSTYISDQSGGTWCDPWYGCYQTVNTNWLDEWDFNGGIILRMGRK